MTRAARRKPSRNRERVTFTALPRCARSASPGTVLIARSQARAQDAGAVTLVRSQARSLGGLPAVRRVTAGRVPRSRYTRSGRTVATAPTVAAVMIPSPMPTSTCSPTISASTVPRPAPPAPPIAYSSTKARERDDGVDQRGDEGGDEQAGAGACGEPAQRVCDDVAGERAHQGHVRDVRPERGQPAVGEQQRLHDQHDRDAQRSHPRPDQDRDQRAAEQVAAGSGQDREVDHLDGEDEGGDEPGHRGGALVEVGARPARGDRAGRSRRRARTPRRSGRSPARRSCAWRRSVRGSRRLPLCRRRPRRAPLTRLVHPCGVTGPGQAKRVSVSAAKDVRQKVRCLPSRAAAARPGGPRCATSGTARGAAPGPGGRASAP